MMQGVPDPIVDEYEHDGIYQLIRVRCGVADGVPARGVQYQYGLAGCRQVGPENGAPIPLPSQEGGTGGFLNLIPHFRLSLSPWVMPIHCPPKL